MNSVYNVLKNIPRDLNSLSVVQSLVELNKCYPQESIRYEHLEEFKNLTNFIKKNIRNIDANHLAGMIYYSAQIKHFQNSLWYHYEMQVGRTNICCLMNNISLVRTAEGFGLLPPNSSIDPDEALMQVRVESINRIQALLKQEHSKEFLPSNELSQLLYVLTSLNQATPEFLYSMSKLIVAGTGNNFSSMDWAKILWSYTVYEMLDLHAAKLADKLLSLDELQGSLYWQALWSKQFQS